MRISDEALSHNTEMSGLVQFGICKAYSRANSPAALKNRDRLHYPWLDSCPSRDAAYDESPYRGALQK